MDMQTDHMTLNTSQSELTGICLKEILSQWLWCSLRLFPWTEWGWGSCFALNRSKSRSCDYIQLLSLLFSLRYSFIPRPVHQGESERGRSSLSSAAWQIRHETINITEQAIRIPGVPVWNLASSHDTNLQGKKNPLIVLIWNAGFMRKKMVGWQALSTVFISSACLTLMERMGFALLLSQRFPVYNYSTHFNAFTAKLLQWTILPV